MNIKKTRTKLNLTFSEFARLLQVSTDTCFRWENLIKKNKSLKIDNCSFLFLLVLKDLTNVELIKKIKYLLSIHSSLYVRFLILKDYFKKNK